MKKSNLLAVLAVSFMVIPAAGARPGLETRLSPDLLNTVSRRTDTVSRETTQQPQNIRSPKEAKRGPQAAQPWATGEKADMAHLNVEKCLKNGALRLLGAGKDLGVERSDPQGVNAVQAAARNNRNIHRAVIRQQKQSQTNLSRVREEQVMRIAPHMDMNAHRPRQSGSAGLNTTMLMKSGAMQRESRVRTPRIEMQRNVPSVQSFRRGEDRTPIMRIRVNEQVGGRCFGHNCR